MPFFISDDDKVQQVAAKIKFTVALAENLRGTHMSRLMEILTDWTSRPIKISDSEKFSPVSAKASFSAVDCELCGELERGSRMKFILGLSVPFTSLCPCSREISDFGAHNQRSLCRVKLTFADADKLDAVNISRLVRLIEAQGSAEVFPLLKREDEKFVTEAAYCNPKFVEDILRDVVTALRGVENLAAFAVECENFESIHNHNAFAAHEEIILGALEHFG